MVRFDSDSDRAGAIVTSFNPDRKGSKMNMGTLSDCAYGRRLRVA